MEGFILCVFCLFQAISTPFVPFVWTNSASIINSQMVSLDIRNYSTQTELEIVNLTEPVDLRIRKGNDALKTSKGKVEYTETLEHSFSVKHNRSSINIEVDILGNYTAQPSLVVYLRKGERPTMDGDEEDKVRVIPQFLDSSGKNSSNFTNEVRYFFKNKMLF